MREKRCKIIKNIIINGEKVPLLEISETLDIQDRSVYAISSIIVRAKQDIEVSKKEKKIVNKITKYIKNIDAIQYRINLFKNDLEAVESNPEPNKILNDYDIKLEDLAVIDGKSESIKEAQVSFETHKSHAKEILKSIKQKNKGAIQKIKKDCIKEISLILKKNGTKSHRVTAIVLLNDNDLDIPSSY